jgi:hypothetical protein
VKVLENFHQLLSSSTKLLANSLLPHLPGNYKSQVPTLALDEVRPDFFIAAPRE